jgi:hypothetical protein
MWGPPRVDGGILVGFATLKEWFCVERRSPSFKSSAATCGCGIVSSVISEGVVASTFCNGESKVLVMLEASGSSSSIGYSSTSGTFFLWFESETAGFVMSLLFSSAHEITISNRVRL